MWCLMLLVCNAHLREMWDLSHAYCTDTRKSWSSHAKHHSERGQTGFASLMGVENTSISELMDIP